MATNLFDKLCKTDFTKIRFVNKIYLTTKFSNKTCLPTTMNFKIIVIILSVEELSRLSVIFEAIKIVVARLCYHFGLVTIWSCTYRIVYQFPHPCYGVLADYDDWENDDEEQERRNEDEKKNEKFFGLSNQLISSGDRDQNGKKSGLGI